MTKYLVVVVGDDVAGQLAPFDINRQVEPYREHVDRSPTAYPRSRYAKPESQIDPLDDEAVASAEGDGYGVDDIGLYWWSTINPDGQWDRWWIAEPWLLVSEGSVRVYADAEERDGRFWAARLVRGDLDIDGMKALKAREAALDWERFMRVVDTYGPLPSSAWLGLADPQELQGARDLYWADPTVSTMRASGLLNWGEGPWMRFERTEAEFTFDASNRWSPGFALLHEGRWLAPGNALRFGGSDERPAQRRDHDIKIDQTIANLSSDTQLTVIGCHF